MSLKNKEYIADGIASCYNFEIANAKDLEYVQGLLKQKYYKKEDVEEHCRDAIDRCMKPTNVTYNGKLHPLVENWNQALINLKKELGL